jgi:hypothetical protein
MQSNNFVQIDIASRLIMLLILLILAIAALKYAPELAEPLREKLFHATEVTT